MKEVNIDAKLHKAIKVYAKSIGLTAFATLDLAARSFLREQGAALPDGDYIG